ncbi:response regulator [Neptuniibacter sp. 2_MG-2023]|jgi:CheY-like chemotaxis protein|uniref:response regulator n=1 Tax=Neptuniibacter sp. 2_MG-2023 TaxID=3062671 RepID=UPI0026E30C80|nr:response regulator [Neptuniibacter sp. 2_MG-2023]MDO6513036.1 response regulator [Neptuniibacter sp. 2_MG-2023]
MSSGKRFSVLLIINSTEEIKSLCNMVKRHFPRFYTASTEEEALRLIAKHQIDVLLLGLDGIQKNEVFYLHLLSAKQDVDKIIFKKMVFCSRDELKEAFGICNKDVFDDYFIIRPLYDPYHLLLRLRFIRREMTERDDRGLLGAGDCSVENLCGYFDQIINCDSEIADLNEDNYAKLMELVSYSMKHMKDKIIDDGNITEQSRQNISSLIDTHAKEHIQEVGVHQKSANGQMQSKLNAVAEEAKQKKARLDAEKDNPIVFDDSNILLLEDEVEERDKIKMILEDAGYKAQISGSAIHTMKLLKNWKPDIILLDLTLPDMSALFVIDQIKQDPEMSHTRIMVLAKPGDTQNAREAMKQGVHEVMLKPVDKDMLLFKMGHNLEAIKLEAKSS